MKDWEEEAREGLRETKECKIEIIFYGCKEGAISFCTQCYNPFDEQNFFSNLFLPFLTSKTCYLCNALKLSCYVDKAVKISLISFPFQDLFLSTLFSVSEWHLGSEIFLCEWTDWTFAYFFHFMVLSSLLNWLPLTK